MGVKIVVLFEVKEFFELCLLLKFSKNGFHIELLFTTNFVFVYYFKSTLTIPYINIKYLTD